MASKDRRKDKKSSKKYDENMTESKSDNFLILKNDEGSVESKVSLAEIPSIQRDPTPESVYDEPCLAELIVTSFEGQKVKGLYEGEGEANFTDGHCYKGMFSEGFMHGKGVYTWSDGIVFEGDFLKNQITGKGKYTWCDGSTYIGDVLNGKRHGYGTFQDASRTLTYTGEWYQGNKHGRGRLDYDADGKSYYDGEWVNGIKHGWGTRQYASGNIYHGMWFNNVRHGEGTMKWLNMDQVYIGQWENGIQHGVGQHIWLLHRVHKSQYPLRNMYAGELVNGKRHGQGTFYYANGAKYEGFWKDNMKQGKGKFTFKNGRTYEGIFIKDHIAEYPDFSMDGTESPDITKIRTKTPVVTDTFSVHSNESKNTVSPSFQLDVSTLLSSVSPEDSEHEIKQVMFSITRHVSSLHRIYNFYSMLGNEESLDNTYVMNKMQLWQFLKDIHLHHGIYTLTDMDREIGANYQKSKSELHNPFEKVLQRQFVNYLIILAHLVYKKDYSDKKETGPVLDYCFSRLMQEKVLYLACNVKSPIFSEKRRAMNALIHMDQAYDIYQSVCTLRKHAPKEPILKMRQFLLLLKDLGIINKDLTPTAVLQILRSVNPSVSDKDHCYNMELEMTFLEFFEALIGCAETFVTENIIRGSTSPQAISQLALDTSATSLSISHEGSQGVAEDAPEGSLMDVAQLATAIHSPTRVASSIPGSQKSGTAVVKVEESPSNVLKDVTSKKLSPTGSVIAGADQAEKQTVSDSQNIAEAPQVTSGFISRKQSSNEVNQPPLQNYASVAASDEQIGEQEEYGQDGEAGAGLVEDDSYLLYEEASVVESDEIQDSEAKLLAEATKKFNYWTHQIHIFFVGVFFPSAEKYIYIKKVLEARRLEEARKRMVESLEPEEEQSDEKINSDAEDEEEDEEESEDQDQKTDAHPI